MMMGYTGMYWAVLGCTGLYWAVLDCTRVYWDELGCTGLYWGELSCTGLDWAGGPMVEVVRMISLDYMHSENIWLSWSKPPNYREKLRCHACVGGVQTEEEESGK